MTHFRWPLALAAMMILMFGTVACNPPDAVDTAADLADDAAEDAGDAAESAGDVAESVGEAAEDAADAVEEVADDIAAVMGDDLGTSDNPIVMSFVPSGEQDAVVTGSEAIRDLLAAETGLTIESNVATSYAAVVEAMGAGNAHVGWLNTFSYILANEKYDVEPVLVVERFGSTSYASLIIAREDSGIESLADVDGVKFCRPDPLSTSGWIIPSVTLQANGISLDGLDVIDSGGHDGVVTAVYNGDCDAGAVYDDARSSIEEEYADVKDMIGIIETSDDIPNDNVSVVAGMSDEMSAQIRDALMAIAATDDGAEVLQNLYGIEAFAVTADTFYDDFRATLDQAGVDVEDLATE